MNIHPSYSQAPLGLFDEEIRSIAPSVFASQPIEGVSDRYTFLPTSSILQGMRENGWVAVKAQQQRVKTETRQGFQKHLIKFARRDQLADQIRPELVVVNSHDKSSAYQLHAGIFRLVCTNGMIIADSLFERIRIKHYGSQPEAILHSSYQLRDAIPAIIDRVDQFRMRLLTDEEKIGFAAQAIKERWYSSETAPIGPEKLLRPRRYEDNKRDLWTVLNTIQENLIKGGLIDYSRRQPNGRAIGRSRGVKAIDREIQLNKGLWELAAQMLEGGSL